MREKMIDSIVQLSEHFTFSQILLIIIIISAIRELRSFRKSNDVKNNKMIDAIETLTYKINGNFLDENATEDRFVDIFTGHSDKKWITISQAIDENGFSSEERRSQVREIIEREFDTITKCECLKMNKYKTAFGKAKGDQFWKLYQDVRSEYLEKVFNIMFSGNKKTIKKTDFYTLTDSYLEKIKEELFK